MNPTVRVYPQKSLDSRQIGRAFIGISLKPRKQQNVPQLGKVLDWTKEHIGQFDLLVGDFLNRHNYEAFDGMEEPAAAEVAMQHGRETVEQLHHLLALHSTTDADVLSAHALYSD